MEQSLLVTLVSQQNVCLNIFKLKAYLQSLDAKADFQLPIDGTQGCLPALVKLKTEKYPHLRILLSIGGGSGSTQFPSVAADGTKTRRFCETAKEIVLRYHLDGIDGKYNVSSLCFLSPVSIINIQIFMLGSNRWHKLLLKAKALTTFTIS